MFQTESKMTLAVSGTGHTAMECAIFNTVEPGDSVLMAVNGIWGERAADMAERIGKAAGTLNFESEFLCEDQNKHAELSKICGQGCLEQRKDW